MGPGLIELRFDLLAGFPFFFRSHGFDLRLIQSAGTSSGQTVQSGSYPFFVASGARISIIVRQYPIVEPIFIPVERNFSTTSNKLGIGWAYSFSTESCLGTKRLTGIFWSDFYILIFKERNKTAVGANEP